MNLEQLLQYLAEHTFGKHITALSAEEMEEVSNSCVRKASSPEYVTLVDGSYCRYEGAAQSTEPFIPAPLEKAIDVFVLIDCDVETAKWLRERRGFPPELMEMRQIEGELAGERASARETAERRGKQLVVVRRERNVDFAQALLKAVLAAAPQKANGNNG